MVLGKGDSGSNVHVRTIILVTVILVTSKKLKPKAKKVVQGSSAYTRVGSTAGPHKGLEPEMVIN